MIEMYKYTVVCSHRVIGLIQKLNSLRWFSAKLSYLQKSEKWVYCFPLMLRIKSSIQICSITTFFFQIRVIKCKFCSIYMISQLLPNFKTQFSKTDEVGSYDDIALYQRFLHLRFLPSQTKEN